MQLGWRALLAVRKQQAGAATVSLAVFNALLARLFAQPDQAATL